MGKSIRLKKGFTINIKGEAQKGSIQNATSASYAIKPTDFLGIAPIPKLIPELGSEVKAGDAICYDKSNPDLVFTAPVSGELVEVRRGAKRRIEEIIIIADKEQQYKNFGVKDVGNVNAEDVRATLIESGAWHFIRQRPFNVTAKKEDTPKGIFISGFNTAPLAPDTEIVMAGQEKYFKAGIAALAKIAPVHLSVEMGNNVPAYTDLNDATVHEFAGKHPAGNVGIQLHHINPIAKGETAWTIDYQSVITIGRLFLEGIYKPEKVITVAGNAIDNSSYYRVIDGIQLNGLLSGIHENARVISGDILGGTAVAKDGFLGFFDNQVTVIPEGDKHEFFGWLLPSYPRPTLSRTLLGSYLSKKAFNVNTNMHGEKRAFVMTGQYEKVLPMNVYPVQLLKAIIANDFEMMEGLGIYEVVEEDLALCEFVCTSKQPVQKILREGLDYMREQA